MKDPIQKGDINLEFASTENQLIDIFKNHWLLRLKLEKKKKNLVLVTCSTNILYVNDTHDSCICCSYLLNHALYLMFFMPEHKIDLLVCYVAYYG